LQASREWTQEQARELKLSRNKNLDKGIER
jgi:hypothetical protein